ncbi:winged helix DNA-binding domain-containing protein [Nocardioides sp. KR10-350]|uniref:winged helix DNA-binding domain-containing protein n=1 Tax=Nocardioides cheoyonin TaxID=3156615 RepID=UPI0032B4E2FA
MAGERLSARRLNRTLLLRQHLLTRADLDPPALAHHLVGLQAQEPLSPYLSLAARLASFDPYAVSQALYERRLVRILSLRDTVHLHLPDDALTMPVWCEPVRQRERRMSQAIGEARDIDPEEFRAALADVLTGPTPVRRLGDALAERFPGHRPSALGQLARVLAPLLQAPPRGAWKSSGGVVYEYVDRWLGRPTAEPHVPDLVRRYLRAFGPATAADLTAWSGVTRLAPLVRQIPDLVVREDESGRTLYDVPDAPLATGEEHAPVRLLGTYDNVWLSHAGKDRVTTPEGRRAWMGAAGGSGHVLLADGRLEGIWKAVDGRVRIVRLLRDLSPAEEAELAEETARVEHLLSL